MPVDTPEELTPGWLSGVLDATVSDVSFTPVGTGQMSGCYRLSLRYSAGEGPATLIAKLPSPDPAVREGGATTYATEVRFYRDIASTVAVRAPACSCAVVSDDGRSFVLLLEDMSPAEQGDQIAGCTLEQAHDAVVNLAGLHGPRWCDESLARDPRVGAVRCRSGRGHGDRLRHDGRAVHRAVRHARRRCRRVARVRTARRALDDSVGRIASGSCTATTASTTSCSRPRPAGHRAPRSTGSSSPSAFPRATSGSSSAPACRTTSARRHERALVAAYHDALVAHGVDSYSPEQCWDDYRIGLFQGPLITVLGAMYATRTERGDEMFVAMTERCCRAIRDADALAAL